DVHVHITSPTTSGTCGTVANSASASATNETSGTNNSVGPVNITVNCPDIQVTKTADASTVSAGTSIGYVVTVKNIGTGNATGVTADDALPTNSASAGRSTARTRPVPGRSTARVTSSLARPASR